MARSHQQCQSFVVQQLRVRYGNGALLFVAKDWSLVTKFWITDLSNTFEILRESYSHRGPQSVDPADVLRSYLLMLDVGQHSVTGWVNDLRRCPLYAILSGFEYGQSPDVGTFYDFFSKLWAYASPNLGPRRWLGRKKPERGRRGGKAPTTTPNRIAKLITQLQKRPFVQSQSIDTLLCL